MENNVALVELVTGLVHRNLYKIDKKELDWKSNKGLLLSLLILQPLLIALWQYSISQVQKSDLWNRNNNETDRFFSN